MLLGLALALAGLAQTGPSSPDAPRRTHVVVRQRLVPPEAPIPGLRVDLGCLSARELVGLPGERAVLATIQLDGNGLAGFDLEPPRELGSVLWARVVSPGYQQDLVTTPFDPGQPQVTLWVSARRGGTLYGEIAPPGEQGEARIRLVPAETGAESASLSTSDAHGRFGVHFAESGRHHLQVSWAGHGMAFVRDLTLDPLGEPTKVRVDLTPGLALAGRVLDPDGVPVYSLLVSVLLEELLPREAEVPERAWSDGYYGQRVVTDREGRFRLTGLPPGTYALIGALDGPPQELSGERFVAGEGEARVEARIHRLRVRVLDDQDVPIDLSTTQVHAFARRPGGPLLAIEPSGGTRARGLVPFPSEVVRAVDSGDELQLSYLAPRTPLTERAVTIPEHPWLVEESLRLPPPVEPARLRLRVSADEKLIGGHIALGLFSPTGLDLGQTTFPGPTTELELAQGTYRVRVQPMHSVFCYLGDPEELVPPFAFAEASLQVAPGESRSIELDVPPNARLRVVIPGPRQGDPKEMVNALNTGDHEGLRRAVRGERIELVPVSGGPPLRLEFSVALPECSEIPNPEPWAAPGRECISLSTLAPGRYRLRAFLADGRVLEREIELAPGATTLVELGP